MSIEIPFGWHVEEQCYKDPRQVLNGDKCGCICIDCKQPLQAAQGSIREDYFRHKTASACSGNLESLIHKVAKQIISEHHDILDGDLVNFHYDLAVPEQRKYGKQPDIYLSNLATGQCLVVEIFYSHLTDLVTLDTYLNNNERVLEIDISCTRNVFYDYAALTALVLYNAPRSFLEIEQKIEFDSPATINNISPVHQGAPSPPDGDRLLKALAWIGGGLLIILGLIIFRRKHTKSRRKNRF